MKTKEVRFWITSDTHLGHSPGITHRDPGFEDIIKKNLRVVNEGDVLIHLGDFCLGEDEKWHDFYLKDLKCKKILILGNHDSKSDTWYYNHGWDFVCRSFVNKFHRKKIIFTHVPIPKSEGEAYDMNIHGHLHGNDHRLEDKLKAEYDPRFHYDVGVDPQKMKPILLNNIVK